MSTGFFRRSVGRPSEFRRTHTRAAAGFAPLAIGLTLTTIALIGIPVSNGSFNPARALATAIYGGPVAIGQVWVTILAPIVVAIDELARHGFVHTRLASSDVLFDDDGRPRLIGLGAVRHLPDGGAERTALRRLSHERLAELVEDVVASVVPSDASRPSAAPR